MVQSKIFRVHGKSFVYLGKDIREAEQEERKVVDYALLRCIVGAVRYR